MRTPWHFWFVGLGSLLWNSGGLFDFMMLQVRADWYIRNLSPEQLAYFNGFPTWSIIAWAVATIGAVLGSVLLLARMRAATMVFALSFVGMLVNVTHNFMTLGLEKSTILGPAGFAFSVVILIVGLLLVVYSRAMKRRAVLG